MHRGSGRFAQALALMSRDIRNLIVAFVLAFMLAATTWYFTQRWLALVGLHYGDTGAGNVLAYLPGWALLLEQLLPGFVVGLVATRWQVLSRALVSYILSSASPATRCCPLAQLARTKPCSANLCSTRRMAWSAR